MEYCLNRLDEPVFMAVSKPLLTEFGIHYRLESCATYLSVEYKKGLKIYTLLVCFSEPHQWCVCSYRMSQISLSWERIWLWELFAVGETPCKFCATLQLKDVSSAIVEILFTLKSLGKRECNLQISHAWFISEDALIPMDKQRDAAARCNSG